MLATSQSAAAGAPAGAQDSSARPEPPRTSAAFDSSAVTEWTEVGRGIAAPTVDRPAYVVIYAKGQHDFGSVLASEKTPAPEMLDQQVEKSLAPLHYLRADAIHQPAYLIVFSWGVHRAGEQHRRRRFCQPARSRRLGRREWICPGAQDGPGTESIGLLRHFQCGVWRPNARDALGQRGRPFSFHQSVRALPPT